jgi:D-3-phosphoglycerate dehydrogenase
LNIAILDDEFDTVRTLSCYAQLAAHKVAIFHDHTKDTDALADRLRDTEAIVLLRERTPIRAALIARLPHLKMLTLNGPYPHVDLDACTAHGVVLCAGKPRPSSATAELTWGLIICAMRQIPRQMASLKRGTWQCGIGSGLRGRTLGVYGYGRIGQQVAAFGRAFGMRVLIWSRDSGLATARADGYAAAKSRQALFEEADVLSLHVRLNAETRGMVKAADLARMKPTALLVNTSRAELVEPGALVAALQAGRPGLAAVDVFDAEPVTDLQQPLLNMDNVVCTPHLGYVERDQLERYYADQFGRVLAFARGSPLDVANPQVLAAKAS